ncbi:SHOCT domain-containing protein [Rhodothermus marinus]|uniref:SHOCT domain-containing protein n=1 Tax=Rhodothermus marinus TaxID=29549 RepID=UPI0006D151F9|nr:SHOCT domain-containing protein [Rhodothermus marinus]
MYGPHMFWGMHWGWWIFWIVVIIALVWLLSQRRTGAPPPPRKESPLELLQRRYAAGEISTEEYEERRARLERDRLT